MCRKDLHSKEQRGEAQTMLNAWRKDAEQHTIQDRVWAVLTIAAVAIAAGSVGMLVTTIVIDDQDIDWIVTVELSGNIMLGTAALIGAIGGLRTLRQRTRADERAEWWKRAEKASDHLISVDILPTAKAGGFPARLVKILEAMFAIWQPATPSRSLLRAPRRD